MKINYIYKGYSIIKENNNNKYPWTIYKNYNDSTEIYCHVDRERTLEEAKNKIDENYYEKNRGVESSLKEHFEKYGNEYSWESTLEEDLIEEDWNNFNNNPNSKDYEVGDIVMINDNKVGVHRILIISTVTKRGQNKIYRGYLLSSKIDKANINNEKFPNNIYIKNYATILERGNRINKEAIIKVDSIKEFDKSSFSNSGTYKGTVTREFLDFVEKCASNYKNGISNRHMIW